MADHERQLLQAIKKLNCNLEIASLSMENLTVQLGSLCSLSTPSNHAEAHPRSYGYVNWNGTHDILKTKVWKKLSVFTKYCGIIERNENPTIDLDEHIQINHESVVDEKTRFPKDDVYVNVCNPLVRADILYIKERRGPTKGLVELFLKTARNDMHTFSSFEEKYTLKWVEPLSEATQLNTLTPDHSPIFVKEPANDYLNKQMAILDLVEDFIVESVTISESVNDYSVEPATTLKIDNNFLIDPVVLYAPEIDFMVKQVAVSETIDKSCSETAAILKPVINSPVEQTSTKDPISDSFIDPVTLLVPVDGSTDEAAAIAVSVNHCLVEPMSILEPVSGSDIAISRSLLKDSILTEVESASKKENDYEDKVQNLELAENFKKILEKLNFQELNILVDEVKNLEITNQKHFDTIVDLLYEKATEDVDFSKACAIISSELLTLRFPSDNDPDATVTFRSLLLGKCQRYFDDFVADTSSGSLIKNEEIHVILDEENRKIKIKANFKFIGELYKLNVVTFRIIDHCLKKLIEILTDERLEGFCELLTTTGKYIDDKSSIELDVYFRKMQEIFDCKSNNISSHVKCMIQELIDLRKRNWVIKSVFYSQLKTMDQIYRETIQRTRLIELMNKKRRENSYEDNACSQTSATNYSVDTLKLKAITPETLNYIKLPPTSFESIGQNMYSILEKIQADQTSSRDFFTKLSSNLNKENTSALFHSENCASVARPIYSSKEGDGDRRIQKSCLRTRRTFASVVPQEPFLDDKMRKHVQPLINLYLIEPDDEEVEADVDSLFPPHYHAALIAEILNIVLEKTDKEINMIGKLLCHLVASNTIASDNFVEGLTETLEFAPDLLIDIPNLYKNLGIIIAPHIAKGYVKLAKLYELCENIILVNQGRLFLEAIIHNLNDSMEPKFVRRLWVESGLKLNQWMSEEQVSRWLIDKKFKLVFKECDETVDSIETFQWLA